jgi:hypothetical protein
MLARKKTGNAVAMGAAFIITTLALLLNGCTLDGGGGGGSPQDAERPEITAYPQGYTTSPNGTAAALTVTAAVSDGGTLSYRWHSAASATEEGTAITGTDGANASYTSPLTAAGAVYYYVVVTNTNDAATGEKTAAVTSNRAKVEVIPNLITYTAVQSGGEESKTDSTGIIFTFSENIDALAIGDITVINGSGSVAKGTAVTGTPNSKTWTLPVTVSKAGTLIVSLTKAGVESAPKTVTVYKQGQANPPPDNNGNGNSSAKTGKSITKFTIGSAATNDLVEGDIDEDSQSIVIVLPSTQTDFTVAVTISEGAQVTLLKAEQNGISVYRVTAENGEHSDYTVYKTWLGGAGLELEGGPFASTGNLSVAVSPPEHWPNEVSRNTGNNKENHFVLTATPGYDHYRWYVDGEQFFYYNSAEPSPDSNVVDKLTGGNYAAGKHTLFLVAIKNGVPYTWEQTFTVIE